MSAKSFGIVMLFRFSHPSNACFPMLVTLSGIVTLVRPLQVSKAPYSILVTPSGIVMLSRFSHP